MAVGSSLDKTREGLEKDVGGVGFDSLLFAVFLQNSLRMWEIAMLYLARKRVE